MTIEPYVDRKELARIMGVSPAQISRWLKDGMPSETWGLRTRRFQPSKAIEWVSTNVRSNSSAEHTISSEQPQRHIAGDDDGRRPRLVHRR